MLIQKMIAIIKNKLLATYVALKNSYYYRPIYYRLSSVDVKQQTAILHVINKSIFIKLTFSDIIFNKDIIEGLSCEHASWIGIYYGKMLRSSADEKTNVKSIKKPSYFLNHHDGRYKIISEKRDGTIECLHIKTKNIVSAHPLSIVEDSVFINYFDANQACYIGMLAGISIEKNKKIVTKADKSQPVSYLRIVK